MSFKKYFLILFICLFTACGAPPEPQQITLSGTVGGEAVLSNLNKPILVLVTMSDDFEKIEEDPENNVIDLISVDKNNLTFNFDLSDKGLHEGDEISIAAYVDINYDGFAPIPDEGDFIGVFADGESTSASYELKAGENTGIHIDINREIFSFEASVEGTINGNDAGMATLIIYTGELNSSDFSDIDYNGVIGYKKVSKTGNPLSFELDVLPFGHNVPIVNAYVFALLDVNKNDIVDAGDKIGYHTASNEGFPAPVTINEGILKNVDINFQIDVDYPPSDGTEPMAANELTLSGSFLFPEGYGPNSGPGYIIITGMANPDDLLENPTSSVKYFEKLPPGATEFNIDLSKTGLTVNEEIMVLGLWDKNHEGGFPNPDLGDFIGFYINTDALSTTCTLEQGGNQGLVIDVNREIFDFDVKVEGVITGKKTGDTVDLLVLLYAGEITSFDFSQIEYNKIIGFKQIHEENLSGDTFSLDYKLPVLPYGMDIPIENTFVIAFQDNNGNGTPDGGDSVGFYSAPEQNSLPSLLTINNDISGIDIQMSMDLSEPCPGNNIVVNGKFTKPEGYDAASPPVFLMVAKADDPSAIFSENPMDAIKYFCKMPPGENYFLNLDLTQTGLCPEDEVILLAMFDKDYAGGFPNPTQGDVIGYLQNKNAMTFSIKLEDLQESIDSESFEFKLNKIYYEHHASIEINLSSSIFVSMEIGDQVIFIATQSLDDMDYVVGMQTVRVTENTHHTFTMLPIIYEGITIPENNFEIGNVYIAAILDKAAENGMPDNGEFMGYYQLVPPFPASVNIKENNSQTIKVRISTAKYNQ